MSSLLSIYQQVLEKIDAGRLLNERLSHEELEGRWDLIALGKAAPRMAEAASEILRDRLNRGIVLSKIGHLKLTPGLKRDTRFVLLEAAHPVPETSNTAATEALIDWCAEKTDSDSLLVLVSGGTSSLLSLPNPPLTPADLRRVNMAFLASGLPIEKINTLRKHLSQVKGGHMLSWLRPYRRYHQWTVVDICAPGLSEAELHSLVGSGPFMADPSDLEQAQKVLARLGTHLAPALLEKARSALRETPKSSPFRSEILADHRLLAAAAQAVATQMAIPLISPPFGLCEEVRPLAERLSDLALSLQKNGQHGIMVATGEPTVKLSSNAIGRGGRCQELALRFARNIAGCQGISLLAGSSDGTDGPTDQAGALVDGSSWPRLVEQVGTRRALDFLDTHDSQSALSLIPQNLIVTGPTGQNINDLILLEVSPTAAQELSLLESNSR